MQAHFADQNVDNAIKACRPETRGLLRNQEHMQRVKETLNDGYCDVSGQAGDLQLIGMSVLCEPSRN